MPGMAPSTAPRNFAGHGTRLLPLSRMVPGGHGAPMSQIDRSRTPRRNRGARDTPSRRAGARREPDLAACFALRKADRPCSCRSGRPSSSAISEGRLRPGTRLPSSRDLAGVLDVARNTAVLAYQQLVDEGIPGRRGSDPATTSPPRARPAAPAARGEVPRGQTGRAAAAAPPERAQHRQADGLAARPTPSSTASPIRRSFPSMTGANASAPPSAPEIRDWARDLIDGDDPMLIDEIRKRVLPLRGVWASRRRGYGDARRAAGAVPAGQPPHRAKTRVGIEDPGYPDARNIFASRTAPPSAPLALDQGVPSL